MGKLPSKEKIIRALGGKSHETRMIDLGWDHFIEQLETIEEQKPYILVGVQDDGAIHYSPRRTKKKKKFIGPIQQRQSTLIAEIAFWNEFGTRNGHVPERSFMRSTIAENKAKYDALVEKLYGSVFQGKTVWWTLEVLGLQIQSDIQRKITTLKIPPNAPSTIRRKKSSNPLIDTGQLRASIRYVVMKGG